MTSKRAAVMVMAAPGTMAPPGMPAKFRRAPCRLLPRLGGWMPQPRKLP